MISEYHAGFLDDGWVTADRLMSLITQFSETHNVSLPLICFSVCDGDVELVCVDEPRISNKLNYD